MDDQARLILNHIDKLLNAPVEPKLPEELSGNEALLKIHNQMLVLRKLLMNFSKGDLSEDIRIRGYMAGALKGLQAHLRHMTWQVQQVEAGDFEQRLDFLGDFSSAFNKMVIKLDDTLKALRRKEEALTELTNELQHEVDMRGSAVLALQESEARYRFFASHDVLTGAYNRRYFMDHAEHALLSAARNEERCSVGMFDIDYFKKLNDSYGHLVGDEALKHVVQVAGLQLRKVDILARYGGEEFVCFFEKADLQSAAMVCERIRRAFVDNPLPLADSDPVSITASFGVCSILPSEHELGEDFLLKLINKCDMALYRSKSSGRNRVTAIEFTSDVFQELPQL